MNLFKSHLNLNSSLATRKFTRLIILCTITIAPYFFTSCQNSIETNAPVQQDETINKPQRLDSLNTILDELIVNACVLELVKVNQNSVDFKIANHTQANLRYVEFGVTFKNDFGDNNAFEKFIYNANDKSQTLKAGYSATLNLNYSNPKVFAIHSTVKAECAAKKIRLNDNDFFAAWQTRCDNSAMDYCIEEAEKALGKLKSLL